MKTINKLKKKLLFIIMLFVTFIIVTFIVTINIIPFQQLSNSANLYMHELANDYVSKPDSAPNNKQKPQRNTKKRSSTNSPKHYKIFSSSNIVSIELDAENNITSWTSSNTDLYNDSDIINIAEQIINVKKDFGIRNGNFYLRQKTHNGFLIILLDSFALFFNIRRTTLWSITAGIIIWILSAILSVYMINFLTKPLVIAMETQQQFISDAEHELKTPISVIASNADVLHAEIGDNIWLSHIISETKRMSILVHELLSLAMIDDTKYTSTNTYFDISETLVEVILPFESVAYEKGIAIEQDIVPCVTCHGNVEQIKQLAAILLHNAIKYGNENGTITVTLTQTRKKAILKVHNTGKGIAPEDINKIFDRFYRVDKSRNSANGGHGLGLSIAKSIVDKHEGSIIATSQYKEWAQFEIQLPCVNR